MNDTFRLAGKVALVTGGTGALGQEVVRELCARGARVHVPARNEKAAARLRAALGEHAGAVTLHEADVTDEPSVDRFFATLGPVDILANVAGAFVGGPIDSSPAATWPSMIAANTTSVYLCCRAAVPGMRARGGGRIINVASVAALAQGAPNAAAYAASKAAVVSLTYSLAKELVRDRITVNAVLPTTIDTQANRGAMTEADRSTWLDPAAIARVIAYLAGPDAAIVTGAAIPLGL